MGTFSSRILKLEGRLTGGPLVAELVDLACSCADMAEVLELHASARWRNLLAMMSDIELDRAIRELELLRSWAGIGGTDGEQIDTIATC